MAGCWVGSGLNYKYVAAALRSPDTGQNGSYFNILISYTKGNVDDDLFELKTHKNNFT